MSLFKNLFNTDKAEKENPNPLSWKQLTTVSQLDEIVELSKTQTLLIFKHSTRCGISRMVLNRFESGIDKETPDVMFYSLDLLNFREVSNEIASRFQVMHQSPQVLVIKNGTGVAHGSHYDILEMEIA